ncbi:hypothetical protein HYX01_03520 [Candidatus Woesearchaeota archaeon]|nr:hypothetical protein [Candidatus Woesearchaeota archaeon]
MAIKDLKARQGNVDIIVDIVDVGTAREFEKFGKSGRVATAIAKDNTGDIKLTLWNDDINKVKPGDKAQLTNGYVSEWQGELQLTTGKFGKLEVIEENKEAKKEMREEPNEEENRKTYKEAEQKLEKIEGKSKKNGSELEEEPDYDEEDVSEE